MLLRVTWCLGVNALVVLVSGFGLWVVSDCELLLTLCVICWWLVMLLAGFLMLVRCGFV